MKRLPKRVNRWAIVGRHHLAYHPGGFLWGSYWTCLDCGEQRFGKDEFLEFKCVAKSLPGSPR